MLAERRWVEGTRAGNVQAFGHIGRAALRGEEQDRQLSDKRISPNTAADFDSVHFGHDDVKQH